MSERDIDVQELQEELNQIKGAMGIQDRYPSQFGLWLVYGVLVAVASAASQFIVLNRFPGWYHAIVWAVLLGGAGAYQGIRGKQSDHSSTDSGKPNIFLQFGAIFAYYVVILVALAPFSSSGYLVQNAVVFGMVVGLVGVAYIVVGTSLAAYYIRKRDRYAFYVGGLWMLGLAIAIPQVPTLQKWGYAVFGGLYILYAIAVHTLLSSTE